VVRRAATQQPRVAVTNLLAGRTVETTKPVPYSGPTSTAPASQSPADARTETPCASPAAGEISDDGPADGGFLTLCEGRPYDRGAGSGPTAPVHIGAR
jgi:hypothetical protein